MISAVNLSDAFRALGHPHRITIVRHLRERSLECCEADRIEDCALDPASCTVGALAELVPCSPSTLSHHLRELESAGIIERAQDGRRILCRVKEERLADLRGFLAPGPDAPELGSERRREGAPHVG